MSRAEEKAANDCLSVKSAPQSLELVSRHKAFDLKKRRLEESSEKPDLKMSSCNSAFLMGLFEDIAHVVQVGEAEVPKPDEQEGKESLSTTSNQQQLSPSVKRRRVSNAKSLTDLHHCAEGLSSTFSLGIASGIPKISKPTRNTTHMDLPATVSDSFPLQQELTCKTLSFAVLSTESEDVEGDFGWYVDMDGDDVDNYEQMDPYAKTSQLAFSASTAPKQKRSYEAELEYALAADTVDDVLGDFF
jgi:hypothetical protein